MKKIAQISARSAVKRATNPSDPYEPSPPHSSPLLPRSTTARPSTEDVQDGSPSSISSRSKGASTLKPLGTSGSRPTSQECPSAKWSASLMGSRKSSHRRWIAFISSCISRCARAAASPGVLSGGLAHLVHFLGTTPPCLLPQAFARSPSRSTHSRSSGCGTHSRIRAMAWMGRPSAIRASASARTSTDSLLHNESSTLTLNLPSSRSRMAAPPIPNNPAGTEHSSRVARRRTGTAPATAKARGVRGAHGIARIWETTTPGCRSAPRRDVKGKESGGTSSRRSEKEVPSMASPRPTLAVSRGSGHADFPG